MKQRFLIIYSMTVPWGDTFTRHEVIIATDAMTAMRAIENTLMASMKPFGPTQLHLACREEWALVNDDAVVNKHALPKIYATLLKPPKPTPPPIDPFNPTIC